MSRLTPARHVATLAALGLALATTGCQAGTEQTANAATGQDRGTPEPSAATSNGPIELPAFDPSSAVGTYADGFPPSLFPMPKGATLLASSAEPASEDRATAKGAKGPQAQGVPMTEVTLNLSSGLPTQKVIEQAKQILLGKGFEEIPAPERSGLTAQTAFLRSSTGKSGEIQESLLVGVLDDGKRRLTSISGTVRTP